ncbi:hypothetical protein FA378_26560 [Pseudomonas aeruginosa]|nr:hypothetical protein [Pseudomonas aeruginosa]
MASLNNSNKPSEPPELYAYFQLAEMKAYFSDQERVTWNQFDPSALISYSYIDAAGEQIYAQAPLIDFLNGSVAECLKKQGVDGGFEFPMRTNSEVSVILKRGIAGYLPGRWTKEMALRDAAKQAVPNGKFSPPQLTDLVTVKVRRLNPMGYVIGSPWQVDLPLDSFIQNGTQTVEGIGDYDEVSIKWPDRYPLNLQNILQSNSFREKYFGGDIAVADFQQWLGEDRKEPLEEFDIKYKKYSNDDYLKSADLRTQYRWQDLVFNNDGTPIGFAENDVLDKAINFVELQIVHNERMRDMLAPGDNWRADYQAEIDKLFGVLKVLHQKESDSLRLTAQSSVSDALIDSKVQEFASASLSDKAQKIAQHPHLKDLKADSPLTVQRQQGSEVTRFSMPLARVLGGEHERIATDGVRVEVEWPSGLSTADPLLQELIDECTVYRHMLARGLAVKEAQDRLRVPTVMQQLQSDLERVVREEAPAGQKHISPKLTDTVNVRFTPMVIHNPEHSILKKNLQVVNKTYTLMQVMAKAPEREYIKMTHYRKMEVDTDKKFPAQVIQGLRDIDWQRRVESTVQELRQNNQLAEDWKLVFGSLIADKMAAAGVNNAAPLTLNGDRLPGVYMLEKSGGIELHSLFSKKSWTFDSLEKAVEALNKTGGATTATLYDWLDEHRDAYEREANSGANSLLLGARQSAGRVAENAFGDLLDQMASDADTLLKSNAELNTHRVFQFISNVSPLVGLATMPISGPAAFLVSAGLAALPFAELTVADTKEEFKETAVQAGIAAAFEVGPMIALSTLSKVPAKQIAKGIAQKLRGVGDDLFKGLKNTDPPLPTVRLEPLRQMPSGKVGNLAAGADEYLELLKKDRTVLGAIDEPAGQCEALLTPVATRIQQPDIGMTNIRYRATQLWSSGSEQMPTHHFVVVGEKGGQKYVFDLSAGQFGSKGMPDLDGPLILTEADWAQKYANASSRKLIKYKDFRNPSPATTEFHPYPGHSPMDVIDGGTLLTAPQWYKTMTNWKPTGVAHVADDVVYALRDAVRANMLSGSGQGVCWDYATDVLREADILTPIQAKRLTDGFKKASNYRGMGDSGRVDNLIADIRSVSNNDELLRVKPGELVVFMEVDPNLPAKGARPVHVMTSLGNGRFAGMKNDLLNSQLGTGKGILTAEELGSFRDNGFFRIGGGANTPALEIKVGYPMGAKVVEGGPSRIGGERGGGGGGSVDTAANTNALGTQPLEGWRGIPHGTLRGPRIPSSLGTKLIGKDNPLSKPRLDLTETGIWPGARGTLDINEEEAARIYMNSGNSHELP